MNNLNYNYADLYKCCASKEWANKMLSEQPFVSKEDMLKKAQKIWFSLELKHWLEAFKGHSKIGDLASLKDKYSNTSDWSAVEQSGVQAAKEQTLMDLKKLNDDYLDKFGFIFIVCATGKTASEMLEILRLRIQNSLDKELKIAAEEQDKITKLRLEKL